MRIFRVKPSHRVVFLVGFIAFIVLFVYGAILILTDGPRDSWGQVQVALLFLFLIGLGYLTLYGITYKIIVDEKSIFIDKPPLPWLSQEKFRLRWDEVERLEAESFLFPEYRPYVLNPKKASGKKPIRITPFMEDFPELMEIILEKVRVDNNVREWINWQLDHLRKKWPLTLRRFLFLMVFAVAISLIACWILGIFRFPSLI